MRTRIALLLCLLLLPLAGCLRVEVSRTSDPGPAFALARREAADGTTGDGLGDRLSRRLSVRDLDRAGLGLLFELEEEQGERVLVWLQ